MGRAGTLESYALTQTPDERATRPRSLTSPPIPHVWLRLLPLCKKAPLPFRGAVLLVGLAGVEPTMWESKSHALPLGDSPI